MRILWPLILKNPVILTRNATCFAEKKQQQQQKIGVINNCWDLYGAC
jgi:hypothetical protein